MQTQTVQLKLTLPTNLMDFIQAKAAKFGLPVASYVRHVLIKEVEDQELPTFKASQWIEEQYQASLKSEKSKDFTNVTSTDELFDSL